MKLHVEANIGTYLDVVDTLPADLVAEYRALTTDSQRQSWLREIALEIARERRDEGDTEIDSIDWYLQDDD